LVADHFSEVIRLRDAVIDQGSPEALHKIRKWLDVCEAEHERCGKKVNSTPPPTYLIDVDEDPSHHVRLIRTNNQMKDRYIALSYVWGVEQQPIELRQHTEETMLAGVFEEDIPRTILDAIHLTRKLNVRYLWVDSWCIVQDDKSMKAREIARMSNIFGSSFLTIQAASAESVNGGFLKVRAPRDLPEHKLRYSQSSEEYILLRPETNWVTHSDPTGSRAWCYEESVLPRRLLIFGQDQLSYRCSKADQFETGRQIKKRHMNGPGIFELQHPTPAMDGDRSGMMLKLWYNILSAHYTSRLLTKPHDRLPAINAIARVMQTVIAGRYLAGLWENDLLFGLLWWTSDRVLPHWDAAVADRLRERNIKGYKSRNSEQPSWSWAAVDHPILHASRRLPDRILAEVSISEACLLEPNDPFGGICGKLTLYAPLRTAVLVQKVWSIGKPSPNRAHMYEEESSESGSDRIEACGEATLDSWECIPANLICALVTRGHGLLLEATDGCQRTYRRLGLFSTKGCWLTDSKFAEQEKTYFEII